MTAFLWRGWEVGSYDDEDVRLGYAVRNFRTGAPNTEVWFESSDGRVRYQVGAAVGARKSARDVVGVALGMSRSRSDRVRLDLVSTTKAET